jgi:hypothetical protein
MSGNLNPYRQDAKKNAKSAKFFCFFAHFGVVWDARMCFSEKLGGFIRLGDLALKNFRTPRSVTPVTDFYRDKRYIQSSYP